MNSIFQLLYLTMLAGTVMVGAYAMCKRQQVCSDGALREALVWGGCFVLSAGVDYLMIVPGGDYLVAAT